MSPLPLLALLALPAADDVVLSLAIEKGGDLRWSTEPCSADVFDDAGRAVAHVDRADEVTVPVGRVDVVVACPAQEGVVRKTTRLQAKKPQTVKVKLAPGFVVATVERGGKNLVGEVVVYDAFDHEVARGKDRTVLAVDAGRVRVQGLLAKATAGTSRDVRGEQTVTVKAGAKSELKLDASDGEIVVDVSENGRPAKALIALREPGSASRAFELVPGVATEVPSGTWDIVTQIEDTHDFREQLTKGVVVVPGKKTAKSVSHQTGRVTPVVNPADGVVVDLLLPGADAAFNQIDPNTEARLSPGRYVVRATRNVELDDGSKPTASTTVTVSGSAAQRVTLTPAVAHLDVDVRVGGEPRALPVQVFLPGAAAALVERMSNGAGAAAFDIAPQRVTLEARLAAAQGALVARKEIALSPGKNRARLDFDVGTVVVQVMRQGVASAADVRFFERLKDGKPAGEARVAVHAGEEAFLPPGIYVLAVRRKDDERLFGEVRVAAGRVVERAIDWLPSEAEKLADTVAREAAERAATAKSGGKQTVGKKPDDKKTDDKKTDDKKTDDKKTDDKKTDDKKIDDKKTDDKKTDDKKTDDKKIDARKKG